MFQAVLFDMDGLFINSEPDWHAAELEMMRAHGYDWTHCGQGKRGICSWNTPFCGSGGGTKAEGY